jgi:ABC-type multidrug transport system fused ATPase/permease subunit
MTETQLLTIAASLVACMFGLLATVIGWMGSRAINALDAMKEKLNEVASELHERINGIDTRLVRVETKLEDGE